jgi:hypothetical protein
MYTAIGKYGEYGRYSINLATSDNIDILVCKVIKHLNSLQPKSHILIFVYQDNNYIGRIISDIFDGTNHYLKYLNDNDYKIWCQKRKEYFTT